MIDSAFFFNALKRRGAAFFTGVPDSLLKSFSAYISDNTAENQHITAVNEGAALALAAGFHLATGRIPVVYMQNSGLGNAINPLLSLCDAAVYRIPVLLIIGWRGEPRIPDEPQHITQGRIQEALLATLELPHAVLTMDEKALRFQLDEAFAHLHETGSPYALVVRKNTFVNYNLQQKPPTTTVMSRENVIEAIMLNARKDEVFFSTTGMASRELYELREKHRLGHEKDFLTVGSMGHTASIALGFALARPETRVSCLDGDGAALMHLGALAAIGERKPQNFRHFLLNNGAHDSVGGQPTIAPAVDFCAIARAAGYGEALPITTMAELQFALQRPRFAGTSFFDLRVSCGARADLGRPKGTAEDNKRLFMERI